MKSCRIQAILHTMEGSLTIFFLPWVNAFTSKDLSLTERLIGYSQTCHPDCIIITTGSNPPTEKNLCYYSQTFNSQSPFQNYISALFLHEQNPIGVFLPKYTHIPRQNSSFWQIWQTQILKLKFLPPSPSLAPKYFNPECFNHQVGFKIQVSELL